MPDVKFIAISSLIFRFYSQVTSSTTTRTGGSRSNRGGGHVAVAVIAAATVMLAMRSAVVAQQVAYKSGRLPRVYNALITSDQRLLPSQADPIVTPVFRPLQFFYGWPAAAVPYAGQVPYSAETPVSAEAADASSEVPDVVAGKDEGVRGPVKNNGPADSSVPDVPPPPFPVTAGKKDKKKPEEYPPAPVGFAI